MVQLSATMCSYSAILWVSLVNFEAITLCVVSQRVFIVVFSLWLSPETFGHTRIRCLVVGSKYRYYLVTFEYVGL
jgi:hypothetical protein